MKEMVLKSGSVRMNHNDAVLSSQLTCGGVEHRSLLCRRTAAQPQSLCPWALKGCCPGCSM